MASTGRVPTKEDEVLRKEWKAIIDQQIRPSFAQGDLTDEEIRRLARVVAQGGLQGAVIGTAAGGRGLPGRSLGVMLEELAPAIGFSAFHVAARFLALYGTEQAKRKYLAPLLSGDLVGCAAISEPGIGSDAANIKTTARREGDHYILDGCKSWVWGGSAAHVANLLAVTDSRFSDSKYVRMFVDLDGPTVSVRRIPAGGLSLVPMAELVLTGHRVPASNVLGGEGKGLKLTLSTLEASRCAVASQAVGIARAAHESAIEYAKQRHQFGRQIASFQLVQRLIADMAIQVEAAALLTRQAWDAVTGGMGAARQVSMAKVFAPDAAIRVCNQAVEIFGAAGLLDNCEVRKLLGYARGLTFADGTTEINELILGRELLGVSAITGLGNPPRPSD